VQQGHQASNKNLSKEEYEKILLHGAATIMQQKNDKVSSIGDGIDIEKIIKEGEERHHGLKQAAQSQAEMFKQQNAFDFSLEAIDTFKFQDKDFREEKKKVQELIMQQAAQQQNQLGGKGRHKR